MRNWSMIFYFNSIRNKQTSLLKWKHIEISGEIEKFKPKSIWIWKKMASRYPSSCYFEDDVETESQGEKVSYTKVESNSSNNDKWFIFSYQFKKREFKRFKAWLYRKRNTHESQWVWFQRIFSSMWKMQQCILARIEEDQLK